MDIVSAAAAIAGLVQLADIAVTRGYKYIKAVKDCDSDVKRLIGETNALGALLNRLANEAEDNAEEEVAQGTIGRPF
jgi:hypothetical protein